MAAVTVPGTGASTISESFDNANNLALAQQIANALAAASKAGTLNVTTASSTSVPPPPPNPGGINELIIATGGDYTIPGGTPPGSPDWVVILDSAAPVTIHGSPNMSVWGGLNTDTIIDPAAIGPSEFAGDAVVTVSGTGDVLAGNNHNDTLTAAGVAQSIAGGTGTNVFSVGGANDTVSSQGKNDTLFGGAGGSTFLLAPIATGDIVFGGSGGLSVTDAGKDDTTFGGSGGLNITTSGSGARPIGGSGALNALDIGTGDTINAGTGAANITLAGSSAIVGGSSGSLTVLDTGASDTVFASVGFTSVSAPNGSVVYGGPGLFSFVGGAGPSTIIGSSGNGTIVGGTGGTTVNGGAGGELTYINTAAGGVYYGGRTGDETIDASLSKGPSTLFGGFDSTGHNVLIGGPAGDFLTAGSGADTLVGGGGANGFYFWTNVGGPAANDVVSDFSAIDYVVLGPL